MQLPLLRFPRRASKPPQAGALRGLTQAPCPAGVSQFQLPSLLKNDQSSGGMLSIVIQQPLNSFFKRIELVRCRSFS